MSYLPLTIQIILPSPIPNFCNRFCCQQKQLESWMLSYFQKHTKYRQRPVQRELLQAQKSHIFVGWVSHKDNPSHPFVDISMLYAGTELKHEYRKAVFKQIKYLRTNTVEHIFGISSVHMPVLQPKLSVERAASVCCLEISVDMPVFQPNLMAIDGIFSVHRTNTTDSKGTWRLLTKHDIPRSSLLQLDKRLATIHGVFRS